MNAPVVVAHQRVPVDAEALSQAQSFERIEDVSGATQLASRKGKISMETESEKVLTSCQTQCTVSSKGEGVQA